MVKRTLAIATAATLAAAPSPASDSRREDLARVQLLAVNDFHGNLEPPGGTGGVAYLAAHLRRARQRNPATLVVSAGDPIGASPLVSGLLHDRPTIEAFDEVGLDANAVGNHELDEGPGELRRLAEGARFPLLSANVLDARTGEPVFRPSVIERVGGVRIGLIGATVRGTPAIAPKAAMAGLAFRDEAEAINAAARDLRRRGVSIDRRTGEVVRVRPVNHEVTHDVAPAPDLGALVARYRAQAAPTADRVLGRLAAAAPRRLAPSGESAAGDLLADAQLTATRDAGAVAALTNAGGLREGLPAGEVRYEDAYDAQPFGRQLVTATYSGAQLRAALRQQWCGQTSATVLSVAGISYRYDQGVAAAMVGHPCAGAPDPVTDLAIGGEPVRDDGAYRITVSDYLADGGDWLHALADGRDRADGPSEVDALAALLGGGAPVGVPVPDRIGTTALAAVPRRAP